MQLNFYNVAVDASSVISAAAADANFNRCEILQSLHVYKREKRLHMHGGKLSIFSIIYCKHNLTLHSSIYFIRDMHIASAAAAVVLSLKGLYIYNAVITIDID